VNEQCKDPRVRCGQDDRGRQAAQNRLQVFLAQAEIVHSLGASVRQAFEMAGMVSRPGITP
jgi:hypothetical protein